MKAERGTFSTVISPLEIARIELDYASADLALRSELRDTEDQPELLEHIVGKLRLARAALASAYQALDEVTTDIEFASHGHRVGRA